MIKTMETAERDAALAVADLMAAAARTAPKGSGKDKVVTMILTGEDKAKLVDEMHRAAGRIRRSLHRTGRSQRGKQPLRRPSSASPASLSALPTVPCADLKTVEP